MNVKKAIKNIVSLGMGVTMVGSTIMGAMAATLSQYPEPFTKDGSFNALLVVGAAAQPMDIIGVTDIATSLQYATKKVVSTSTSTAVSVSEGVKLEKTGAHMYMGLSLQSMQDTALDDSDLPEILMDGTFDDNEGTNKGDYDYTQKIYVDTTGAAAASTSMTSATHLAHDQDDSDAVNADVYLKLDDSSGKYVFKYALEFSTAVDYDPTSSTTAKDDLKTNSLDFLGKTYTITDATISATKLNKITMLAGRTTQTIAVGSPVTVNVDGTDYELEVLGVTNANDKCQLSVNSVVSTIDVDDTASVSGIEIGITDAAHFEGGSDSCQINVGAEKLVLENGQEISLNDEDISGTKVTLIETTSGAFEGFTVESQPEDNVYLRTGEAWNDPVFGAYQLVMGGEHADREDITFSRSGKEATLEFTNYDGKLVEFNWYYDAVSNKLLSAFGDNTVDERIYLEGETCTGTSSIEDCEGARFLAVTSSGVARVIEIKNIDTTNRKIDFKDLTYNKEDKENAYAIATGASAGSRIFDISGVSSSIDFLINETANTIVFTDIDQGTIKTDKEAVLVISNPNVAKDTVATLVTITEKTDDAYPGATTVEDVITVKGSYVSADSNIDLTYSTATAAKWFGQKDVSKSDTDNKVEMSLWGTIVEWDSENSDSIVVKYPESRVYYDVFVAPISATTSTTETSGLSEIVAIGPGATKLDNEVSDYKAQNVIVVGGPCVNTVAAALMGNPTNCAEGFEEGKAMIKLFNHDNGKVALMVAGYSAQDTRAATMWMNQYSQHASTLNQADTEAESIELAVASLNSVTPSVN